MKCLYEKGFESRSYSSSQKLNKATQLRPLSATGVRSIFLTLILTKVDNTVENLKRIVYFQYLLHPVILILDIYYFQNPPPNLTQHEVKICLSLRTVFEWSQPQSNTILEISQLMRVLNHLPCFKQNFLPLDRIIKSQTIVKR